MNYSSGHSQTQIFRSMSSFQKLTFLTFKNMSSPVSLMAAANEATAASCYADFVWHSKNIPKSPR